MTNNNVIMTIITFTMGLKFFYQSYKDHMTLKVFGLDKNLTQKQYFTV